MSDETANGVSYRVTGRAEPCNGSSNQVFNYDSETGRVEGTGDLHGKCLFADSGIVPVIMAYCGSSSTQRDWIQESGDWIQESGDSSWVQDSQGRLVSAVQGFCLTLSGTEVVRTSCQDGVSQMMFWEPPRVSSDAPSLVPSSTPSSSPSTPNSNQHAGSNSPTFTLTTAGTSAADDSVFYDLESTNIPGITNNPSQTPLTRPPDRPVTQAPLEAPSVTLRPIPTDTGRGNIFGRPLSTPEGDS